MICNSLPASLLGIAVLASSSSCPRHSPPRDLPSLSETQPATAPIAAESNTALPDPRPAIARALPVLLADGDAWMEGRAPFQDGQGCVSCHQVPYGVWGLREAARAGVVVDSAATDELTRRALAFVDNRRDGRPMSWSPLLLALGDDGGEQATAWVDHFLASQRPDGFWEARGQFPTQRRELSETNAVATMFSLLALTSADAAAGAGAAAADALDASLDRARDWLRRRGPGDSTEWLVLRALVAEQEGLREAARRFEELVDQQNPDGGWGWNPGEESNALSTGEALWALARASPESAAAGLTEAARRGLIYLVASQGDDGWWRVASDLTSSERTDGKDYVYDYWGTAWATVGLARWRPAGSPQTS